MSENEANIVAGDANAPTEETSTAAATEETSTVATEETQTAGTSAIQPEARQTESTADAQAEPEASTEEISYHAVEKDGQVTALWEMQGRKHLRTIDPRSRQGQEVLRLYTSEHPEELGSEAVGSETVGSGQ